MPEDEDQITELLRRAASGDRIAEDELVPKVYNHLRRVASVYLSKERQDHSLQATALVHEAYIRIFGKNEPHFNDRSHFFRVAAQVMRNILVDHARGKKTTKRGGESIRVPLDEVITISDDQSQLVLQVDEALARLEQLDKRQAKIVELRFFAGLTEDEIAEVLGVSSRTVKRDWVVARAWLHGELTANAAE